MQCVESLDGELENIKLLNFVLYFKNCPAAQVVLKRLVDRMTHSKKHVVSGELEDEVLDRI